MSAPSILNDLIGRFQDNLDAYKSPKYNEAQLRGEFINPLFEALGWDVYNKQGYAEAYKDVIHEDAIKVGGATKAPDYSFRIGGVRKFFLETKKPSVNIKDDPEPAFQLRRYAWSAKLPLSILTDFEEFAVYDCRIKPAPNDKPSTGRIMYFNYEEYPEKWEEIASVFSREAILKGSFDRFVESEKKKRGTAEVDDAFLKEIESWRDVLARNIALRNEGLTERDINFAVQLTIDRIIFLRICEDRGIEEYGRLMALQNGEHAYKRMLDLYYRADEKYNSGLFHFQSERGRPGEPDELTPDLKIDDKVLKDIIKGLYYPESPYEFSVLPVDILGHVYERFLGKVIRLTAGGRAKVEEKPEVRKAGGVYYTPKYIVDYIVKNTVGKLVEGKKPKQVETLRILDPACGSGSFLIGAYEYLLDWHRDWYVENDTSKYKKQIYQGAGEQWYLTTAEKKKILLNNIYGVDIDAQAVEVTKLNLLLKALEGENEETIESQLKMFRERALPDLRGNIKCGNSLIGPDFYDSTQLDLLDDEERYRINAFDWEREFEEVMEDGGFSVVIGNPPYFNIDDMWGKGDKRQRYIKYKYKDIYNDKTDIYYYFLYKACVVSKMEIGFIVSRAFLEAYKAEKLRIWLSNKMSIREILDFQNHYVFEGVGITTAIILMTKGKYLKYVNVNKVNNGSFSTSFIVDKTKYKEYFKNIQLPKRKLIEGNWIFAEKDASDIINKIDNVSQQIGDILHIGQGMQTGRNNVFASISLENIKKWKIKKGEYYLRARNSDIQRYDIKKSGKYILYLENFKSFDELPEGVQRFLNSNKDLLKERAAYKRGDCVWWKFTWPLHKELIGQKKILCPYLASRNRFALDEEKKYLGLTDTTILYESDHDENIKYFLALLNSKLLDFRFKYIGKLKSNGIFEYFWNSVSKIPIKRINFNTNEKKIHDNIIDMVDNLKELSNKLVNARSSHEKTAIQRQIDATDRQIDELVYELYGITEEERRVVEGED